MADKGKTDATPEGPRYDLDEGTEAPVRPPPLPTAARVDADDLSTIPAPKPFEIEGRPESFPRLDDTRQIADLLESRSMPPAPVADKTEAKKRKKPSRKPPPRRLPSTSVKARVFAAAFAGAALFALVFALVHLLDKDPTPPPPPPKIPATVIAPSEPTPDEIYEEARATYKDLLAKIGGEGFDLEKPGVHQSLLALFRTLEENPEHPLLEAGGDELRAMLKKDETSRPGYDEIWKLGLLVLDVAKREKSALAMAATNSSDPTEAAAHTLRYEQWLNEWLLGPRGVYCQVRERFWEQRKKKNPEIPKEKKGDIKLIRQERRLFLTAAERPVRPMYTACDRGLVEEP